MRVEFIKESDRFRHIFKKLNNFMKERVEKQIRKLVLNPHIGKPMRYNRKGTREVYIGHFRLSYAYFIEENKIILLDFYHKDEQ
ncbi:MAG: type II toxin-antitoxin system RelE/ParE family toxin [Nanoarchaeota archaeon]|nr:type II toxin-antitoxin system RelE/ParE family toxin [Nanoarchaeota archaeon]MBU4116327.1 type II toxin-antitoxin system RelE/ParE family toxin [Nanoarchaeota archaeon]